MELKSKFIKAYANLPLASRREIVVVLDGEPLTWNSAWVEVSNETKKGREILKKLKKLGIM